MPTPERTVTLDLSAIGTGKLLVDGHDLSEYVAGVEVTTRVGKLTRVVLHLINVAVVADVVAEVALVLPEELKAATGGDEGT